MVKRLMDLLISSISLVLFAPLLLIIAVIIRIDSPGPAFFKQERIGLQGRPYRMYKFRTMNVGVSDRALERFDPKNMDEFVFQEENDPRITRFGRFLRRWGLDELPHSINVF